MPISAVDRATVVSQVVNDMASLMGVCSFNGLTFGAPGSEIYLSKIDGIHDKPGIKIGDLDKTYDHGMWPGIDFFTMRVIHLDIMVIGQGNADFLNNLNDVLNAFQTTVAEIPFYFMNQTRYVNCRMRKCTSALDIKSEANMVMGTIMVELNAMDPRIYDANTVLWNQAIPTNAVGVTFGITMPVSFTPSPDPTYSFSITNQGNFDARGLLTIYGPIAGPRIENITQGLWLWWPNLTLGSTDYLTIDLEAYGSWFDGTGPYTAVPGTPVNYLLSTDSQWWNFAPGTNLITFHGNSFGWNAARVQIPFASAWT